MNRSTVIEDKAEKSADLRGSLASHGGSLREAMKKTLQCNENKRKDCADLTRRAVYLATMVEIAGKAI